MKLGVEQFRSVLPKTAKPGDVIRLSTVGGKLQSVVIGVDYRIAKSTQAEGDLETVYVYTEPLVKGLEVRAPDLKVNVVLHNGALVIKHGEFRLTVPQVVDKSFEMPEPKPVDPSTSEALVSAVKKVAAIIGKDDKAGLLIAWGNNTVSVLGISARSQVHSQCWLESSIAGSGRLCISRGAADQLLKLEGPVSWWMQQGTWFLTTSTTALRIGPIRDSYPKSLPDILTVQPGQFVCSFSKDALVFAIKSAMSALSKDDIGVTLSTSATTDNGVVFDVSAKNIHTKTHAVERVVAETLQPPVEVSVRLSVKHILSSLGVLESETVEVGFGKNSIRLTDGKLVASVVPLV